jgi:hypothetical protein
MLSNALEMLPFGVCRLACQLLLIEADGDVGKECCDGALHGFVPMLNGRGDKIDLCA